MNVHQKSHDSQMGQAKDRPYDHCVFSKIARDARAITFQHEIYYRLSLSSNMAGPHAIVSIVIVYCIIMCRPA